MKVNGRFWIEMDGEPLVGRGRIELLERIHASGSIAVAAKAMGMGYKAAWDAVEAMSRVSQQEVVLRSKGGRSGGGSRLTAYGVSLIENFRRMEQEHGEFLQQLQERYAQPLSDSVADED